MIDYKMLVAPFPSADLDWRVGNRSKTKDSATLLVYLTSRAIQNRLDEAAGPGSWSSSLTPVSLGKEAGFICTLSLLTDSGWVSKSDVADATDIEALKGAASGALKRAAVLWGIGRYLYAVGSEWHQVREGYPPDGSDAVFCPRQDGKPGHIIPPRLPDWALPPLEQRGAKKETVEQKAERQATHHASWDGDQARFMARLAEIGVKYEEVCKFNAAKGKPRPSQMDQAGREAVIGWLMTPKGAAAYATFIGGAP